MSILPWKFSLFRGGFNTVQPYSASVKEDWQLDKLFHSPSWKPSTFNKKKLDCWSPSLYPPGKTRANKNVQSISAIVFDYDGGTWSPARMGAHLKELGIAYAVYTTWSHDDEEPRYRVVIFIDRPLSRKEFTIAREAALSLIGYTEGVDAL